MYFTCETKKKMSQYRHCTERGEERRNEKQKKRI